LRLNALRISTLRLTNLRLNALRISTLRLTNLSVVTLWFFSYRLSFLGLFLPPPAAIVAPTALATAATAADTEDYEKDY
jgi:hypothetical protein